MVAKYDDKYNFSKHYSQIIHFIKVSSGWGASQWYSSYTNLGSVSITTKLTNKYID